MVMQFVWRAMVIIGLGGLLMGIFQVSLLIRGTSVPENIDMVSLGSVDGSRNVHLTISNFVFGDGTIIESDERGRWKKVWIPLLNPDGTWPTRPFIAHSSQILNEAELQRLLQQITITGVISDGLQGVGMKVRHQLKNYYPDVKNLDDAYAFEIGRSFPSPWLAFPMLIGGLIAIILGIRFWFGIGRKNANPAKSVPSDDALKTGTEMSEPLPHRE